MLTTLLILRWVGVALWLAVLWRLWHPLVRAFGKTPLTFDPLWAIIWAMVANRLAYQASSIIYAAPADGFELGWRMFLQIWTMGLACMILWLKHQFKTADA